MVTFIEGDVRELKDVIKDFPEPFDVVINAWTSIGYFTQDDELNILGQAKELSSQNAVLFIAEAVHSEFISLKFTPTSYMEVDDVIILEEREYDRRTSRLNATWAFYRKRGDDLEFIDRVGLKLHIYSPSEISSLLERAGWEVVALYGNLSTLQPMSPLTSLNVVAKAR